MALNNRNDIRFHKEGELYQVMANSFDETKLAEGGYKHHYDGSAGGVGYEIQSYEFVEDDSVQGVVICPNGVIKCHEFIEGELTS